MITTIRNTLIKNIITTYFIMASLYLIYINKKLPFRARHIKYRFHTENFFA